MYKIVITLLLIINISACNPIKPVSQERDSQKQISFACLSSQNECEVNFKYGRFTIQFSGEDTQGRLKTELPFYIQVLFDATDHNYQLKGISSYLEGKTMFMGKIPVFFEENQNSVNTMVAQSLLASCSEEVMTWRLWFQIELMTNDGVHQQDFFIDFDSVRL